MRGVSMTTILLIRHGHVEGIAPERFRGRTDLPLTERGLEEARATSRRISATWRVAAVYTSPMSRSLRTGQIIAEPFGLDGQPMAALNDIDYGQWHGLTPDEARARWPREVDLWYRRPEMIRVPGGETLQDVLARTADALRVVLLRHPEDTVVLVGHDCVNRVILLHALELPLARYWHLAQAPCAINQIIATEDGFTVWSLNETWHLGGV
jgi:probable phosphoglycerate mutase